MKWYTKAGITTIFLINSFIPFQSNNKTLNTNDYVFKKNQNKSYSELTNSNLIRIIEKQEEELNIKHFGIPEIEYIIIFNKGIFNNSLFLKGYYNKNTNKIFVIFNYINDDIESTISHELGHYYLDMLNENLNGKDWPEENTIETKLISEGIAEYFERITNNEEDDFKDSEYPKDPKDFWEIRIIYDGGYHLVKPVIDLYKKEGIEYLMFNPPSENDLKNIIKYQERIIKELKTN